MNSIDHSFSAGSTDAARPIRVAAAIPVAVADVDREGGGAVRPYTNDRLNSRTGLSLPDGAWEVRWTAELARGLRAEYVLHAKGRSVVQGADLWQLFDDEGTALVVQRMAPDEVVLDPDHGLLYSTDTDGALNAFALQDGRLAFSLSLLFGSEFDRVFTARRAQRMLVASVELPVDLHEPDPPSHALAEVHDLGDPIRTDDLEIVVSSRLVGSASWDEEILLAAMDGDVLVTATPGRIELRSLDLSLLVALEEKFVPVAMSLDETGRVYMIADAETEAGTHRRALWVVTPAGEKIADVDLNTFAEETPTPPAVGYDHRIYLIERDTVHAYAADGTALWSRPAGGLVAGVTVTADHQLLVTAGQLLSIYDATGERKVLFVLQSGRWTTAPVLTDFGRIVAATEKELVCLTTPK